MGSEDTSSAREQTLRTLYEEHAPALHRYVLRLLSGDRHRAEDVVQETLLRSWLSRNLDTRQSLRPWLFTVARNLVIDDHRQRMARPQETGDSWLDDVATDADDVNRILSLHMLGPAVRALSPAHREVLYETYYVGRSTREAALAIGVPQGTVKSRLYHALRALRLALGPGRVVDDGPGERAGSGRRGAALP
ncbi:sigma-70 family RNA polymerase sigma factor [Streptomyces sp. 4N509B]|uniref:sigma-70 family RNA polymerase sigma factor n=1 Tax=Streptomyces sp. 4N509B TaxID=3457413 RepID=UPI003FD1DEC0